ncbi:MAG: glycine zipper domain-containing protein [Mariprofundaceae bacterium]|nr:glycine zipper domain-containing protein [Mariprofundaceae bacterium]
MKKIVLILCFISGLAGCVTTQQDRAAMRGGAVGATAGAVIGSSTGDAGKGAVIGGILGAATGVFLQQNQRQAAPQRRTSPSRQYVEQRSNQRHYSQESDDGEQGYRRSEHEDD